MINMLGVPIDNLTMPETIDRIFEMIGAFNRDGRPRRVATVNVDFLVNTLSWRANRIRHPELLNILRHTDLVTADGMPIVWAGRLLGSPLKERVTGADLIPKLAGEAAKQEKALFFLGGRDGIAEQAAETLKGLYPDLKVAGISSPYVPVEGRELLWAEDEDTDLVNRINKSGAHILLIGFGNPKQELWFERNRNRLKVPVSIGIGGTYEFISGTISRAPEWMQKRGLEWIFRLTQDPKRLWRRYLLDLIKFSYMVIPSIMGYQMRRLCGRLSRCRYTSHKDRSTILQESMSGVLKVISFPYRLDGPFLDQFRDEILGKTTIAPNTILDLNHTFIMDASGLGFMLQLWHQCHTTGTRLYMMGVRPSMIRLLKQNRLWDLFGPLIYKSLDDVFKVLKEKKALPSFYSVAEAERDIMRITLFGSLDADQLAQLDLNAITKDIGNRHCLINLRNLRFVDSSGLVFFLKMQKYVSRNGKMYILCEPTENVYQMFRITKLDHHFQIAQDISVVEKKFKDSALVAAS